VLALEEAALAGYAAWRLGLEQVGLQQERRALRLAVQDLAWTLDEAAATLTLSFYLPAGAYATTVLREVVASGD
jgi:tRNA pseudouridine13 synthase